MTPVQTGVRAWGRSWGLHTVHTVKDSVRAAAPGQESILSAYAKEVQPQLEPFSISCCFHPSPNGCLSTPGRHSVYSVAFSFLESSAL